MMKVTWRNTEEISIISDHTMMFMHMLSLLLATLMKNVPLDCSLITFPASLYMDHPSVFLCSQDRKILVNQTLDTFLPPICIHSPSPCFSQQLPNHIGHIDSSISPSSPTPCTPCATGTLWLRIAKYGDSMTEKSTACIDRHPHSVSLYHPFLASRWTYHLLILHLMGYFDLSYLPFLVLTRLLPPTLSRISFVHWIIKSLLFGKWHVTIYWPAVLMNDVVMHVAFHCLLVYSLLSLCAIWSSSMMDLLWYVWLSFLLVSLLIQVWVALCLSKRISRSLQAKGNPSLEKSCSTQMAILQVYPSADH